MVQMIDTKAVRALADDVEKHWAINRASEALRQCADEIDTLRSEINEWRQSLCEQGEAIDQLMDEREVLRQLAEGAVLCRPIDIQGEEVDQITAWYPIEEQL